MPIHAAVVDAEASLTRDALARQAVAEALHVDGRYRDSASIWTELASRGFNEPVTSLKAAVGFYSAGDVAQGDAWIARARAAGARESELLVVAGQHARLHGDLERAREFFGRARELEKDGSIGATNGLGVTLWELNDRQGAARCFETALRENPCDGLAATNLGRVAFEDGRDEDAARFLALGAALATHRPEPFVLLSRFVRRRGELEHAQALLIKARLRRAIQAHALADCGSDEPVGRVRVSARIRRNTFVITTRYELQSERGRPVALAMNPGYDNARFEKPSARAHAAPRDVDNTFGPMSPELRHLRFVEIPSDAWRDDGRVFEFRIEGLPAPPCVHLGRTWFELGAESGWLPIPMPTSSWIWDLDLDLAADYQCLRSTEAPSSDGTGVIALQKHERVGHVVGNVSLSHLEHADRVVDRALRLWDDLAGARPEPCPPVVLLDRPASTFCYTRAGFVRLASGILEKTGQSAIIYHEIAHLWWGAGARFHRDSQWLAEALAEYALHLAEDCGALTGYREATLQALRSTAGGALPPTGLAHLARTGGHDSAMVLRAKGGFLISMLREVIGTPNFERTLREAHALGRIRALDTYTFFALASWFHGCTLHWFVNQWVFADGSMQFELGPISVQRALDGRFDTGFEVSSHGVATPGAPVDVEITLEGGELHRTQVRLESGHTRVALLTSAPPLSVTIDPSSRWYANIPTKTRSIER